MGEEEVGGLDAQLLTRQEEAMAADDSFELQGGMEKQIPMKIGGKNGK